MPIEKISEPDVYEMDAADYHADPVADISLSSGCAKVLVRRSPLHAHHTHPRLGGAAQEAANAAMNSGTILHRLILGKGDDYVTVVADDWRTKAAREARAEIEARGHVAVLEHKLAELQAGALAAREQMRQHPACEGFFQPGMSEAVLIAREGPTWLRCMVDRLPSDEHWPMFDVKTTGKSAAPADMQRSILIEYAFQRSFYARVKRGVGLRHPDMVFIGVEQKAPHGVAVFSCDAELEAIADMEVERAVAGWTRAMQTGVWPGYTRQVVMVGAPAWALAAAEQAQIEAENEAEEGFSRETTDHD